MLPRLYSFMQNFFINVQQNAYADIKIGSPQAPIHISVFSDFLCSHCAHFHKQLEPLLKQYPSIISVTFRHYTHQGDRSQALSRASICAHKQNQFLPVAHSIYANQKDITIKTLPPYLEKMSSFDISAWETCMSSAYPMKVLAEDQKESIRGLAGAGVLPLFRGSDPSGGWPRGCPFRPSSWRFSAFPQSLPSGWIRPSFDCRPTRPREER